MIRKREPSAAKRATDRIGKSFPVLTSTKVKALAADQGIKPLTAEILDAMGDAWPKDEDIDDFVAWLAKSRREGRNR